MATLDQPNSREQSLAPMGVRTTVKGGISSSATSVASSDNMDEYDPHQSGDGALDRLKSRGSEDGHSEGSSSHRIRMSKLFKGRRSRRKSVQQDDVSQPDTDDSVPPVPSMPLIRRQGENGSEESLGLHKSVPSSLLTEDSDAEVSPAPVRPGISPHHSHAGYLTLSSPLIASETLDSVTTSDAILEDSAASDDILTPRAAQTFDVATSNRGASPAAKLKEAFTPTNRTSSPKTGGVDTAEPTRPSTSAGLGALFGGKKRETRVLEDSVLHASPPQIHTGKETQSSSSLPAAAPRRIITQLPATPPNLDDAPTTFVTPPTPTDARAASPTAATTSAKSGARAPNPNVVVSPSGNMISHRRARSATNPPSRLSNSILAPLTPTLEEVKTPGGTAGFPQSPTGFFSSVFSAAQNAANTFSTTIANTTTTNKSKGIGQPKPDETKTGDAGGEEVIGPDNAETGEHEGSEKRQLAVETLGSGNLSLAHLGITESEDTSPMSASPALPLRSDEASANAADVAAQQAVSAAYAAEKPTLATGATHDRSRSLTTTSASAMSPPRQQEIADSPAPSSVQRQGSVRSRISGGARKRRHRGSSAATGNTIAAAIDASTSTLVPQVGRLNGTGFAVAPPKRNRDFHTLFKSVPEDDYLIEDYSAALQKEILLQGRLYVSEGHLCFSSNILGWVTNLVISFDEVVSVEKKSTAVVFPNAIVVSTLHARNVFASLLTRDATYDLIIGIWKISHPNLKSSLNGVAIDGASGTGDKTEKADSLGSEDGSSPESEDDVYDEDADDDDGIGSFTEAGEGSITGSEIGSAQGEVRKVSATVAQAVSGGTTKLSEAAEAAVNSAPAVQDFPGAATHASTDCGDGDQHYEKLLIDTTIPAPLGKIFSLTFGPGSGTFMRKWLIDEKSLDLQLEDDGKGLGEGNKTFSYSYIKPLGGSIGPKQTKCNITSTLEQFDLNKAISVSQSTQTPDVPSGNIFLTKTRYCLMWGPNNSTRVIMTFTVEWSGKSWLRGPIEKGANDGQLTYATKLSTALRNAVATKSTIPRGPGGKAGKGKKRNRAALTSTDTATPTPSTATPAAKENSWGLLDPLRSLLGPVADIIDLLITKQTIIIFLFSILLYTYFFGRAASPSLARGAHMTSAQRQVAYEQLWRDEEADLWTWLEERVTLDRVHSSVGGARVMQGSDIQHRLVAESMKERQIDEAIRTTEKKLSALKHAVRRERETGTQSPKEAST